MPESRMTASSIYENPTMADLMKQGEQGVGAHGLQKTETTIFKLIWNQGALLALFQRKGHTLLTILPANYRRNFFGILQSG